MGAKRDARYVQRRPAAAASTHGPGSGLSVPALVMLILPPLASALAFIGYTGEVWEDFLITFRHTENFVRGNGLVYQVGERVHGFTSVLNTLLPAPGLWLTGSLTGALRFYQACSLALMGLGLAAMFAAMARRLGSKWWELAIVSFVLATSIKVIAFASNGQEGGLLVGFLGLAIAAALQLDAERQWIRLGTVWAGLLYTRPDSPLYAAITALVAIAVWTGARRDCVRQLARASAVAAILYAPWLLIAWLYYGSPIPHTIIAKSNGHFLLDGGVWTTVEVAASKFLVIAADVFGPIYQPGNWPGFVLVPATVAGLSVALYWAVPVRDPVGRSCSAGLLGLLIYLAWISAQRVAYPWYFVPASLLGAIVAARAGSIALTSALSWVRFVAMGGLAVILASTACCLTLSFKQLRIQQSEIEEQTRKQAGLWLRQHAKPTDTVFLECLGYIGYYSGCKMLDYPGLVAPEVVEARRRHGNGFLDVPVALKPDWMVVRLNEGQALLNIAAIKENYAVVEKFDARPRLDRYGEFAGESWLRYDGVFYVFRRNPTQK